MCDSIRRAPTGDHSGCFTRVPTSTIRILEVTPRAPGRAVSARMTITTQSEVPHCPPGHRAIDMDNFCANIDIA